MRQLIGRDEDKRGKVWDKLRPGYSRGRQNENKGRRDPLTNAAQGKQGILRMRKAEMLTFPGLNYKVKMALEPREMPGAVSNSQLNWSGPFPILHPAIRPA